MMSANSVRLPVAAQPMGRLGSRSMTPVLTPSIKHTSLLLRRSSSGMRSQIVAAAVSSPETRKIGWDEIYYNLRKTGLPTFQAAEAKDLIDRGEYILVDVRTEDVAAISSPKGSISIPLFKSLNLKEGAFSFGRLIKATALTLNGVKPVEANENFIRDLKAAAGGKGVILACEAGGTLVSTASFPTGKASRSLKAAEEAQRAGIAKVAHLSGGVYGWYQAGLEFNGEYNTDNVGRTPNAAEDAVYPNQKQ